MTVINMMSFGKSGAAVADEQSSGGIRKYNTATKLRLINNSMVYGGSGSTQFLKEGCDRVIEELNQIRAKGERKITPELIFELTKDVLSHLKNSKKNKYLIDNFGITLGELQTGVKQEVGPLDKDFKDRAYSNLVGDRNFNGSVDAQILLGGLCNGKFEIFYMSLDGGEGKKISVPYATIGSGSDESDKVLSRYISEMPKEQREIIPVQEGLVKLIEATNAAANSNIGVGGIPSIVYINEQGKIITPGENQCILISEIIKGYNKDLLSKDFVYDAVDNLVIADGQFKLFEEQMKKQAKDWNKLDRILRGYKV